MLPPTPDDELRIYIVMRRDIGDTIPKAKFGVQIAHATAATLYHCLMTDRDRGIHYMEHGQPKIVLRVKNDVELMALAKKAEELGCHVDPIVDAGRTVFNEPTLTSFAVGPIWYKSEGLFLKRIQLYKAIPDETPA